MKNLSDEKLVGKYLSGDESALEEIVRRYLAPVYGFSRRYCGDSDGASDITQEIFVKVWKHLKKFDRSKNFRVWLFAIAKNTALDWLKKRRDVPFSVLDKESGENFSDSIADEKRAAPFEYDDAIFAQNARLAVEGLPENYKSVIKLYHDGGFNFREISEFLKEPLNTVKSRYRRGIARLKDILA